MSSAITQLSCFSSIINHRRLQQLHAGSYSCPARFRLAKVLNVMSSDGRGTDVSNLQSNTSPSYIEDASNSHNGSSVQSYPLSEDSVETLNKDMQKQVGEPTRAAKIHDFCFGIPFGGLVLSGGLLGFIFSRNLATLSTGVLFGGALLALSTISLKVWKQGKSSLPFILGQAVLAVALLWKNFQAYSLTQKLFPTGFNALIRYCILFLLIYFVIQHFLNMSIFIL
ncbi:hypothetical protein ACS0TY_024898 [Phlomoides rotata]